MKIAILTHPLWTNYGGILQAYALQTYLVRMGHNVVVINREYTDYPPLKLFLRRCISALKCAIRVYLLGRQDYVVMNPLSPFYHARWTGYDVLPFVKQYINHSREIRNSKSLRRYLKYNSFDCYIVGSDQVWRPSYVANITDYFLKELSRNSDSIKASYAASFGTDIWEFTEEETRECALLVKSFDAVSVREKSGMDLCKQYLGVDAEQLLDPTMLLNKEDYITLFEKAQVSKCTGNLFCYILDKNKDVDAIIDSLQSDGYAPYYASIHVPPIKGNSRRCQISVEEWLRGIYDAEVVITDSFHACVFSILFHKPFIAMGNKERGNARFDSLMEMFGLQRRLIDSYENFVENKNLLLSTGDMTTIDQILSKQRQRSEEFFIKLKLA